MSSAANQEPLSPPDLSTDLTADMPVMGSVCINDGSWLKLGRPLIHAAILFAILAGGLMIERMVLENAGQVVKPGFMDFLHRHTATIVVGFGIAFYLCYVNRELQQRLRSHEQLGPYKLLHLIGSGGMGDVYVAEHQLLKRRCAVKLIRRDKAASRRMVARFEREVKATAQLTHWNTVQVYDYGCTRNGTFYYAMEYLEGLNLRQLVDQHGPLPASRVIYILKQICAALNEAGKYGLVHRDIKPSNIFLAERGQMYDVAKLLDFGLVRPASIGQTAIRNVSRQLQGSPRFMCPEQAQGMKPDVRGDLYSLACVAYFLLTGRAPFEDDNPVMLVVAHATATPPRFEDLGVHVPDDFSALIMKCLSKNPDQRFANARELLLALEQCRDSQSWTWQKAETWWRQLPQATLAGEGEPTHSEADTEPCPPVVFQDPDQTFVCDRPGVFENVF